MQPGVMPAYQNYIPQPLPVVVESSQTFMETEAYYNSLFEWKQGRAILENQLFKIPTKSIMVTEMTKIKLYKELAINSSRKIKITHNLLNDYLFSVDSMAVFNEMPLQYFWFAKIVTMKMVEKGFDFSNPYVPELKFEAPAINEQYISGIIYKLSQHMKKW